jgi:iron complex transport system substrate-binding protein
LRICSFLPSATAMIYALGLEDSLVGVTHECDFPPQAKAKPIVLRPVFDPTQHSSEEIDRLVRESLGRGESIYRADLELIGELRPDLLITQDICEVCAFSYNEALAVREALGGAPRVLSLNPHSVGEMLDDIRRIAETTGVPQRGEQVITHLQDRLDAVVQWTHPAKRPRVLCLEWLQPLMSAGHWVPEMVYLAGGEEGLGATHGNSTVLSWDQVVAYKPDVLVLMPCGFDVERTEREADLLAALPGWSALPAVRNGRVWGVWGHKYFSGAGPHLVDGVEMLGQILHPDRFAGQPNQTDAKAILPGGNPRSRP